MLISFLENLLFECYLLYRIVLDCFNLNRTMICHELSVSKFLLSVFLWRLALLFLIVAYFQL